MCSSDLACRSHHPTGASDAAPGGALPRGIGLLGYKPAVRGHSCAPRVVGIVGREHVGGLNIEYRPVCRHMDCFADGDSCGPLVRAGANGDRCEARSVYDRGMRNIACVMRAYLFEAL